MSINALENMANINVKEKVEVACSNFNVISSRNIIEWICILNITKCCF